MVIEAEIKATVVNGDMAMPAAVKRTRGAIQRVPDKRFAQRFGRIPIGGFNAQKHVYWILHLRYLVTRGYPGPRRYSSIWLR